MTDGLRTGALLTSAEIEGVAGRTDWSRWISDGRAPEAENGNGFRLGWPDDIALLADVGMQRLGITLEWARLEPNQGSYEQTEIEHLRTLLSAIKAAGLEPWACLVDGTLPGWFAVDEHGFSDERSRGLVWPRHVDWIGETFGDLIAGWLPLREGIHAAVRNNWLGVGPPGRHDEESTAKAVQAATLANGEAWRVLAGSAPVAICETVRAFVPESDNVKAAASVSHLDNWYRDSWLGALDEGVLRVDGLPPMSVPQLRDAFDIHIVQARPAVHIAGDGAWSPTAQEFLVEGLATAVEAAVKRLPAANLEVALDLAPLANEEEGADYLAELRAAMEELGAIGWWQTSPIDGWHWERGFDGVGGIVDGDRQPRSSADLFI